MTLIEAKQPYAKAVLITMAEYGVTVEELSSLSRARRITECRGMIAHLLLDYLFMRPIDVATILERDHSTVWRHNITMRTLVKHDKITREKFQRITKKLVKLEIL